MTQHPDWNAILGHELRSPVAAILGYQELLDEGILGPLPNGAADALRRIRFAASQLITLIDAVEGSSDGQEAAPVAAHDLIEDAMSSVRFEAEGRSTRIDIDPGGVELCTRRTDACRAVALVLGAGVKVTPGGTIHVSAHDGDPPRIRIAGASLDPRRDRLARDRPLTGAGLRLELAGAAASRIDGRIDLLDDGTVHLFVPRLPTA
jgi:signal transduction histidine kinase